MTPGLSTASFYPMPTEEALLTVGQIGFKSTEIFFNTISELSPTFLKQLADIQNQYGIKINSVHPMASFAESYMLFSTYERRFYDTVELYKRYFDAANQLGASVVVIHGSRLPGIIQSKEYYERFSMLIDEGIKQGVTVAHENVVGTMGQSPQLIEEMINAIGDRFKMVFDIKQAVRSGFKPIEFAEKFYDRIVQVHISDHNDEYDCLPPGEGNFDFKRFIDYMTEKKYAGDYVIELYSKSFSSLNQLIASKEYIQSLN